MTEMMVVIAMGLLLMLLVGQLFMLTTHTIANAPVDKQRLAQLDGLVSKLREDIWQADAIVSIDEHAVITTIHGNTVTWQMDNAMNQVTRGMTAGSQQYAAPPMRVYPCGFVSLAFTSALRGAAVDVQLRFPGQRDAVFIRLINRSKLLEVQDVR
jgi:hypothetical protein